MRSLNDIFIYGMMNYSDLIGLWLPCVDDGYISGAFVTILGVPAAGISLIEFEIRGVQIGPTITIDTNVVAGGDTGFIDGASRRQELEVTKGETVNITCNGGANNGGNAALLHIALVLTR